MAELPPGDSFEVETTEYTGVNVEQIASEEAFRAAVNTQNAWKQNLDDGVGKAGKHGTHRENGQSDTQYRNTGEAIDSISIKPAEQGQLEYLVGSDRVQVAVANTGRSPGSPPPYKAIEDWAREKGLTPNDGESFEEMVNAIRFAIAERGIPGFKPGEQAFEAEAPRFEERVIRRLNEDIDES